MCESVGSIGNGVGGWGGYFRYGGRPDAAVNIFNVTGQTGGSDQGISAFSTFRYI